jgi:hypothetical protein
MIIKYKSSEFLTNIFDTTLFFIIYYKLYILNN